MSDNEVYNFNGVDGKGSGSGTYSYHSATFRNYQVHVSHMPEDVFKVRIVFQHNGETSIPILKCSDRDAQLLWVALNSMAKDLKWNDELNGPREKKV